MACVITRRARRTKFAAVDFFASDVMGKRADGSMVFVQATAGQDSAVTARRRKLEAIPWAPHDRVFVLQLRGSQDPANRRRLVYHFRVMEYTRKQGWIRGWHTWRKAHEVQREWFKAALAGEQRLR